MNIYALIPARKGSKRLTHKNIRSLNGKLLIEYTIEESLKSKYLDDIFISTDDPVVIRKAKEYGLKYVERPKKLCTDTATIQEVVDHFIMWIPWDRKPDVIVLLQPTSPLRTVKHIDKCIQTYIDGGFDSVVSVKEVTPYMYYPNGAVYVFKDKVWCSNMGMVLMSDKESIDIDTELDFKVAKMILNDDNS